MMELYKTKYIETELHKASFVTMISKITCSKYLEVKIKFMAGKFEGESRNQTFNFQQIDFGLRLDPRKGGGGGGGGGGGAEMFDIRTYNHHIPGSS